MVVCNHGNGVLVSEADIRSSTAIFLCTFCGAAREHGQCKHATSVVSVTIKWLITSKGKNGCPRDAGRASLGWMSRYHTTLASSSPAPYISIPLSNHQLISTIWESTEIRKTKCANQWLALIRLTLDKAEVRKYHWSIECSRMIFVLLEENDEAKVRVRWMMNDCVKTTAMQAKMRGGAAHVVRWGENDGWGSGVCGLVGSNQS